MSPFHPCDPRGLVKKALEPSFIGGARPTGFYVRPFRNQIHYGLRLLEAEMLIEVTECCLLILDIVEAPPLTNRP